MITFPCRDFIHIAHFHSDIIVFGNLMKEPEGIVCFMVIQFNKKFMKDPVNPNLP